MSALVLASGSSYRRQLLARLQLAFTVAASDVDETPLVGETPADLTARLALAKAQALRAVYPEHLIIGSDQAAAIDGATLGKPGGREGAIRQLALQAGRVVTFYTAVCLLDAGSGRCWCDLDVCQVHFRPLTPAQIERYVDREQPFDCAGSFKSEGLGIALFEKIVGDDPNALIGLPLIKLTTLLEQAGVSVL
ncbi:Maf family protein [Methylomonas sp. MS20]|uniref:Maf family protein n=1 Tax=unclassified Methylomonas TaxID=2608980 RepID=UPI0028A3CB6E|nr:nucleoside triphosphate pyrophosphatase [Methylomonas sp. MV1]MDT4329842.1 nucleoside triphosphate pyrophosphatase [Methylomonas sp. MV1]